MFAILAALILRPVWFKYRSKRDSAAWRNGWDWALVIGGAVPALIFGVAMGNVLQGVPFRFNDDLQVFYDGTFFGLLNPFALLAGVVSLSMIITHGSAWLNLKTEGNVQARARRIGSLSAVVTVVAYILAGLWLAYGIAGYEFTAPVAANGPSNPLLSDVARSAGWFAAYQTRPWIAIAPVAGLGAALLASLGLARGWELASFAFSNVSIIGIISSVGLTMFPFILPSSIDPKSSLTVWDASSSQLTLFVMLVMAVIFVPIILAYTAWVYKVLWGKVTEEYVTKESSSVY